MNLSFKEYMGECVCFVGNRFPICSDQEVRSFIEENGCYGVHIVLLGNSGLCSELSSIYTSQKRTLSIISSLDKSPQQLIEFVGKNYIEKVIISVDSVYAMREAFPLALIGGETWGDYSGGLFPLDAGCFSMWDANALIGQAEEVAHKILSANPKSDIEKILLTDLWFQKNIQYIQARESKAGNITYICEDCPCESKVRNVFDDHYGRCEDIAFSVAMVLNHPSIGIRCRQILAGGHSWNLVTVDGKEYFLDVTHNITRNSRNIPGTLMAAGYSHEYTLIGKDAYPNKYTVNTSFDTTRIPNESFDRSILQNAIHSMADRGIFSTEWNAKPVMTSYVKDE